MFASMCARRRESQVCVGSVKRTFYSAAHGKVGHALGLLTCLLRSGGVGRLQESSRLKWKFCNSRTVGSGCGKLKDGRAPS